MEWMLMPLQRYADFNGRSCRKEYWMFVVFNLIVGLGLGIVTAILAPIGLWFVGIALIGLWVIAIFIPSLAVQVRRFHDQDKSGWFVLIGLVPYVGGLVVLVFMCLEGTRGENRFGPDPKAGSAFAA